MTTTTIEGITGLPSDRDAFQILLEASYYSEYFSIRRGFLDQARTLARTARDRRALDRAYRAILRDSWADLAERAARKTAERESKAAAIDQSGESYGVEAFEITDEKSWPVFLPLEVTWRLIQIQQLDDRLRVLRLELQLRPKAGERNLIGGPRV